MSKYRKSRDEKPQRFQERETFSRRERELFRETMQVQSPSRNTEAMVAFAKAKAEEFGATVEVHEGNVYAVKGEAALYPCVIAHSDQVHDLIPEEHFLVQRTETGVWMAYDTRPVIVGGKTVWPDAGIGGDDKVGVYVALNALRLRPVMKIAIFRDEEIGCRGAELVKKEWFADVAFALECDRRGTEEWVERISGTELQSAEFKKEVRPILARRSFKMVSGLMTDAQELVEQGVGVCTANIACGYYQPHSNQEFCIERDVLAAQFLVMDIIDHLTTKRWEHTYTRPSYQWKGRDDWEHGYGGWYGHYRSPVLNGGASSGTVWALKQRHYVYSEGTWWPPKDSARVEILERGTCQCTHTEGQLVRWNGERNGFVCDTCGLDLRNFMGTKQGDCTCGGDRGYKWGNATRAFTCQVNECQKKRPYSGDMVPWHTIPLYCPYCGVGNGNIEWDHVHAKGGWCCTQCLVGIRDDGGIAGMSDYQIRRIAGEREITEMLKFLALDVPEIDFSDSLKRQEARFALLKSPIDEVYDDMLAKYAKHTAIPLPETTPVAETITETEFAEIADIPSVWPNFCNKCSRPGEDVLTYDAAEEMFQCSACGAWTPPVVSLLFAD